MTVVKWIKTELKRIEAENEELYECMNQLNDSVKKIIKQLTSHLEKIQFQMPDYDDHGPGHSEKVLENIEKLLQIRGVESLTLLEAIMLRLCCYLHDAGMCLPHYFLRFLEQIEEEDYAFHHDKPETSMQAMLREPKSRLKPFADVKDQFFCPEGEAEYVGFYAKELVDYEKYRMGLAPVSETEDRETFIRETRQDYLRRTHGERSNRYAQNLKRMLAGISKIDKEHIVPALGNICAAHCWNIDDTFKLPSGLRVLKQFTDATETTCNFRYLAMLLRLGDVLHVSNDRTSRTRYAASDPMNTVSDLHWRIKLAGLVYTITNENEQLKISYIHDGIEKPDEYYFLHDYLNWADDELSYYANFLTDANDERYRLGLPRHVDRSGINPIGFTPDRNLRFRLEQRKIIELLMGARLYRDEWMCLRELYQNALDACRCMMAEDERNGKTSHPTIEFGLSEEEGRKVLYCRDEGTGMTEYIVKNYLLRIGNSYYHSDDFRRSNAAWKDAVAPISEFGIGLLSCYMIADEIEVITQHYTPGADKTIRLRMKGSEDYGYFCNATAVQKEQLGAHGTIVKLYLKIDYANNIADELPTLALFSQNIIETELLAKGCQNIKDYLTTSKTSLYSRLQELIHIPDPRCSVIVKKGKMEHPLINIVSVFQTSDQINSLTVCPPSNSNNQANIRMYALCTEETQSHITAYCQLVLPKEKDVSIEKTTKRFNVIYINGIPIYSKDPSSSQLYEQGIQYNFIGASRPALTVDRERIANIPPQIANDISRVKKQLAIVIAKCICSHYSDKPELQSNGFLNQLLQFLNSQFDPSYAFEIFNQLHLVDTDSKLHLFNIPYRSWYSTEKIDLPISNFSKNKDATILPYLCSNAEMITISDDSIHIAFSEEKPKATALLKKLNKRRFVQVDLWDKQNEQFDFISSLYPFVPKALREISDPKESTVWRIWGSYVTRIAHSLTQFESTLRSSHSLNITNIVQSFSNGHTSYLGMLDMTLPCTENNRQHIFFVFVAPHSLTQEDKNFIKAYERIPQYTQGIKEGWSILFYGYQNGFVIAPGKQDRMDMLRLLPQEVLDLDDGIEYCFTDGTHAFGTKLTE